MIIPSIDIINGRAVQLRQGREFVLDAGDPMGWLERFSIAGEVAVVDLDAALGTGSNAGVIRELVRRAPCRVGGGIRSLDAARAWLDAGATRVVIGTAATPAFCGALPRDRVVAAVDSERGSVVVDGWRTRTGQPTIDVVRRLAPTVGGFLLTQVEHEGAMNGFDIALVRGIVAAAGPARVTAAGGITSSGEIALLDRESVDGQVGMALYTGQLSLADAVAAPLREARDGLWPTIVSDDDGRTLGLAWSNRESLRRAVNQRRGVYWSRSRNAIWVKGETSGNEQELVSVQLDCDRDAIQFIVRQRGTGFCHEGTWSCFGQRFTLGSLGRLMRARAESNDQSSGTHRLIHEPGLLEAKLVEEACELCEATEPDEVVKEAADVLYMVMASLTRAGRSLGDVEEELGRRHRRVSRRPMARKS
jgi:phosphoribosyl-ATP pyrophosphohydrolase/phosphoribosyl-AMP cyclohydrolase